MLQGMTLISRPAICKNYETFFSCLREKEIRLLELGIYKGGSLLLWRDYFPNGIIAGLDKNPVSLVDPTGRIHTYQGLQQDPAILNSIASELGPFDIVIDDASHRGEITRASFWHLFPNHLKPGGIYVIEDWGTGYWGTHPDGQYYQPPRNEESSTDGNLKQPLPNHNYGMVGFIKQLIDECGMEDITKPGRGISPSRQSLIENMQISFGQVFVKKKDNRSP